MLLLTLLQFIKQSWNWTESKLCLLRKTCRKRNWLNCWARVLARLMPIAATARSRCLTCWSKLTTFFRSMCETSLLTNKPQNSYGKKAIKSKPQKSMEEALGESCNKMRGSVEPSEYKHVVLSLIFLKYAGDQVPLVQTQDHSLTLCLAKYSKHLNFTKGNWYKVFLIKFPI